MARQDGVIQLKGQMGGISFYKTRDGYIARKKGGIDSSRLKSDPAFQRTRENGAEFGRAATATRLLRSAIRGLGIRTADYRMASRLVSEMSRIIKSDSTSQRGERKVTASGIALLKGFDFNTDGKLVNTFTGHFSTTIERATASLSVAIAPFVPANAIASPEGATHFRLLSAGIELDLEMNQFTTAAAASEVTEITMDEHAQLTLSQVLTPASTKPMILVFGIEFYQHVNGTSYPLNSGSFNALAIVSVDGGA